MSLDIRNQVVVVSGGGRGLGAAIVRAFVREGARVAINYRESADAAHALANELGPRARAFHADVTDAGAVSRMVEEITQVFETPTTLVHNALADFRFDGDARATLDALTWAALARQAETAVGGALNLLQALKSGFVQHGGGRVIHIGTNLLQNPVVPYHDYVAGKGALLAFTRTAARELGPLGVTVNMVSGGLLRTTDASAATPEAVFDLIAGLSPLGRVTTPSELADAVLFFASPWARAITGQNLVVDCGLVSD